MPALVGISAESVRIMKRRCPITYSLSLYPWASRLNVCPVVSADAHSPLKGGGREARTDSLLADWLFSGVAVDSALP